MKYLPQNNKAREQKLSNFQDPQMLKLENLARITQMGDV